MRIYIDISNIKWNHQAGHPDLFKPPIIMHHDDGTREHTFGPVELKHAKLMFSHDRDARPQVWIEVEDWDMEVKEPGN